MWSAGLVSVFWALANGLDVYFAELELAERWYGQPCCQRARLEGCRRACLQARSADDLEPWCRRSDELDLQVCLEGRGGFGSPHPPGRRNLESCCALASTAACRRRVCGSQQRTQQLRRERLPLQDNRDQRRLQQQQQLAEQEQQRACTEPRVVRCLRNATSTRHPHKLHCCGQAPSGQCRDTCLRVLRAEEAAAEGDDEEMAADEDAVDALLAGGCVAPGLHERLWQCLLGWGSGPTSQALPADGAKLQCCLRAATIECQRMCLRAYGSEWETSWETFHGRCRYQPAEAALRQCLDDVDEPCELGCGGPISFCAQLVGGGRPWSLYRRCDASADRAARDSAQLWMRTGPPTAAVALGNGGRREATAAPLGGCPADAWKALACALTFRPCHATHHSSTLCRADCLALAARCTDGRQLAPLCDSLAPPGAPCLSILAPVTHTVFMPAAELATQPCRSRPCGGSAICVVNRHCPPGQPCTKFHCIPGCPVGFSSSTLVPRGSLARLPRAEGGRLCWTRCQCSESGALVGCTPTGCDAAAPRQCWLAGRPRAPGSRFLVQGCLRCRCDDTGHVSCASASLDCLSPDTSCGCSPDDDNEGEVCGADGRTHRNACLARCAGLAPGQWAPGPCHQVDLCAGKQCPAHAPRCVAWRRACLGPCKQFVCVGNATGSGSCYGPVCDTDGHEHSSVCALMSSRGPGDPAPWLAHRGPCELGCRSKGPVCGLDGETYVSECAAWSQRVLVDYRGPCLHRRKPDQCGRVRCPPLPSGGCPLKRLPGACCPVCGWGLRLVLDRPWRDNGSDEEAERPLSALLWWLRAQLSSTQCDLFGHLDSALPGFLTLLVMPTSRPASWTLCRAEAQRLDALVRVRSPALFSLVPMEAVAGSAGLLDQTPEPTSSAPGAGRLATSASLLLLVLLPLLIVTAVYPAPLFRPQETTEVLLLQPRPRPSPHAASAGRTVSRRSIMAVCRERG